MEVKSVSAFVKYYQRTRAVTDRVVAVIPPGKLDWSYAPGKFSIGDLVRHIAAIERNVFMEVIQGRKAKYIGCGKDLADGYDNILGYFKEMHRQSLAILNSMEDEDLSRTIETLDGKSTTVGNYLRALIVHEVHHRGALCIYLNLLGVKTPPVIGLTEEEVIRASERSPV